LCFPKSTNPKPDAFQEDLRRAQRHTHKLPRVILRLFLLQIARAKQEEAKQPVEK
jgi:hypothetical protein